jgi:hypothetical protein
MLTADPNAEFCACLAYAEPPAISTWPLRIKVAVEKQAWSGEVPGIPGSLI